MRVEATITPSQTVHGSFKEGIEWFGHAIKKVACTIWSGLKRGVEGIAYAACKVWNAAQPLLRATWEFARSSAGACAGLAALAVVLIWGGNQQVDPAKRAVLQGLSITAALIGGLLLGRSYGTAG